jgi:hypothetical protein
MSNYTIIYDESECARCGKKDTLDKLIWSDVEMARVCKECANFPDKKDGGK